MKKLLLVAMLVLGGLSANANVLESSSVVVSVDGKTKELQVIDVPSGTKLHEGKNRNGNPKYWFELTAGSEKIEVSVSATNAEKYMNGEVALQIVKKQNTETGKIYYYSRQNRTKQVTKDIDLNKVKF